MTEYNVYCDESSHLPHSSNHVMTLGMVICPKEHSRTVNASLRRLKTKHDLNCNYELKWTKVSSTKMSYYKSVIDYFCDSDVLTSRIIIADKSQLDLARFNLTHDDWYYRMYYYLLGKTLDETNTYNIFLDIKDTNSIAKVNKLKCVLNNSYYDFSGTMIKRIQHVHSDEVELIQLIDLLIGAVAYKNNRLNTSPAKVELTEYLSEKIGKVLTINTSPYENKFNLFKWSGR